MSIHLFDIVIQEPHKKDLRGNYSSPLCAMTNALLNRTITDDVTFEILINKTSLVSA